MTDPIRWWLPDGGPQMKFHAYNPQVVALAVSFCGKHPKRTGAVGGSGVATGWKFDNLPNRPGTCKVCYWYWKKAQRVNAMAEAPVVGSAGLVAALQPLYSSTKPPSILRNTKARRDGVDAIMRVVARHLGRTVSPDCMVDMQVRVREEVVKEPARARVRFVPDPVFGDQFDGRAVSQHDGKKP